jgi:hypothetical protein
MQENSQNEAKNREENLSSPRQDQSRGFPLSAQKAATNRFSRSSDRMVRPSQRQRLKPKRIPSLGAGKLQTLRQRQVRRSEPAISVSLEKSKGRLPTRKERRGPRPLLGAANRLGHIAASIRGRSRNEVKVCVDSDLAPSSFKSSASSHPLYVGVA